MGAWGAGNFENDAALDMVEDVLKVASGEIEAFCASNGAGVEDLEAIVAAIAVHLALREHCNASAPDAKVARALREKVLRLYDEEIDSLEPEAEYKSTRRAILLETLDRYEKAASEAV